MLATSGAPPSPATGRDALYPSSYCPSHDAAGRKSPDNHAQTARNLRRSLKNAAAGARLIQPDGLDSKSAGELAASLADTLAELHRLQRSLNRRIRRD